MSSLVSRVLAPFAAAFAVTIGLAASAQGSAGAADDHPSLPAGQGREAMIRVCSQCHEPEKVVDQQFDRAGWKDVVDQMAGKGATATEAEFEEIVRYLTTAFPPAK